MELEQVEKKASRGMLLDGQSVKEGSHTDQNLKGENNGKEDSGKQDSQDLHFRIDHDVAIVSFDQKDSKVNTLNSRLMPQFQKVFASLEKNQGIRALVLTSSKPGCFVAGADISELQNAKSADEIRELSTSGQELLDRLNSLKIPVIAAIDGVCLGGGLELALACHYRIATDSPKTLLGLPEVMLGLLPGAGGTQRLPRLIGLEKALPMILTGASVKPHKAKKLGLVDYVCPSLGLESFAVRVARGLADKTTKPSKPKKTKGIVGFMEKTSYGRDLIFDKARKMLDKKTHKLYPAPYGILDVVSHGLSYGFEKGLERESEEFTRLSQTSVSKNLISLYFAQTDLKKNRFGTPPKKVETIGVLGAGLMGAGISLVSLQKNYRVCLKDITYDNLGKGEKYIWDQLASRVKRKSMTSFERKKVLGGLSLHSDYNHFSHCRLVIEAVFEDINLKRKVVQEVEEVTSEDCIFASNTSALPITEIAKGSKRPQNIIGMHYFSPVHKMPLLEVVLTKETSKEAAQVAVDVGIKQGKTVIVVNDGPGLYTTRILAPLMDEAANVCLEGVGFRDLDRIMQQFGFPVGPMALMDEVGLDVAYHVATDMGKAFGTRVTSNDPHVLTDLIAKNSLGRKSGKGFFIYDKAQKSLFGGKKKKAKKEINPYAKSLIRKHSKGQKLATSRANIPHRLALRMLNEACYCLQDQILERPLDGDMGAVFGLGFPPFLGGPFRYADSVGIPKVVDQLKEFSDLYGERFSPCPLLVDMAKDNKIFYK